MTGACGPGYCPGTLAFSVRCLLSFSKAPPMPSRARVCAILRRLALLRCVTGFENVYKIKIHLCVIMHLNAVKSRYIAND